MTFLAVIVIYSVTAINPWAGDQDTGPRAIRFVDATHEGGHSTIEACEARLAEMWTQLQAKQTQIEQDLPKPWRVVGVCEVERMYEVYGKEAGPWEPSS